jgi:Histidine kinase-, DNA gyrase B-, and HSP90-like ATPase.
LTNAYKYTEPYKNVNISYKIENDKFILEVKDQGKGIREEETKRYLTLITED